MFKCACARRGEWVVGAAAGLGCEGEVGALQEIANTLWALAMLDHNPGAAVLDAAAVQILRRIDQFSPQVRPAACPSCVFAARCCCSESAPRRSVQPASLVSASAVGQPEQCPSHFHPCLVVVVLGCGIYPWQPDVKLWLSIVVLS